MFRKRFFGWAMCLALLFMTSAIALAGDRPIDKRDLQGISPKRHRLLFSTLGGAAVGMGVGAIIGGGSAWGKGMLIGGGTGSALYLHSHPHAADGYRPLALIGSHTALGAGIGWTLCDCNTGWVSGALIGGGGTAWWDAAHTGRSRQVGSNQP